MELNSVLEKARSSLLFTAPVLGPDLARFLEEHAQSIRDLARQAVEERISQIYWVGSGNSWVNLFSGKYLLDRYTNLASDVYMSYDFIWRCPKRLNDKSWVFLASFSGGTEDTVNAMRFARERQAKTIVFVNKADSLMGIEADVTIAYNSKALYILPLAGAYLFALEVARLQGIIEVEPIIDGLYQLPALLSRQYVEQEAITYKLAEEWADDKLIYTLGTGPLWGLAYKFGLTVFMENMRIHGSFIDATEFRHGPAEMFYRFKPSMIILRGTDESQVVVDRVIDLCRRNGAKVLVFDMADYPDIHPLLSPFVLMIPLQWFAVWSSLLRGIDDLDERALMGRGIMGVGQGITWP
jgi:fructoselysine 6-phosphate deglycase